MEREQMKKIIILLMSLLIITACTGAASGDPAATVEAYLQAKVDGDADTVRRLLCSEMESVWEREAGTFASVSGTRTEDMACTVAGDDKVSCDGKIVAVYGTEETEFPLVAYRVVAEDGEWKWCGEAP
jgi:hypothetical protein